MPLQDLLTQRAALSPSGVDHLRLLLEEWQILADLSFADLLLFIPEEVDGVVQLLCAGQIRPLTAQTIYVEDLVGEAFPAASRPMVQRALAEGRIIRDADPDWSSGVPVREDAIPVRHDDQVIAVVTREGNVSAARSPSQLEMTYLQTAGELAQMLADGTFPYATYSADDERAMSPRVGDGIVRLNVSGLVAYASPNAISAYRRLGRFDNIVGQHLSSFDLDFEPIIEALAAGAPIETEVEGGGAVVLRRLLPLMRHGVVTAGLMLVREVTDLRRHERALRLKDATIREIHHRVKNNLQTVASLLRLQGRRLRSDEARDALDESIRRISSIALVHETLSQESRQYATFDRVAGRLVDMLTDGLMNPEMPIEVAIRGEAGDLPAEVATSLTLVLAELLQNCVEHAFTDRPARVAGDVVVTRTTVGHIEVRFERGPSTLGVVVADDGVGLPSDRPLEELSNLGLQIARTLIESELGGTFRARPPAGGPGAVFELVVPLP